jgi:hypothetical protein
MTSEALAQQPAGQVIKYVQHGPRTQAAVQDVPFHAWITTGGAVWTLFYRRGRTRYLLRFPDIADFEVSADGHEVQGWAARETVSPSTVEHLYLNQVVPLALSRQGKLVLHASAVVVGQHAVAFIGESGRGKSTLAASLASRGHPFLTDDGLQLEWVADDAMAMPSHPSIRLWEDSQKVLAADAAIAAPPVDFTSKARFPAGPTFPHCSKARPLRRLYFLGSGESNTCRIEPVISSSAALMTLVRNSFLLDIAEQEMLSRHFDEISRIAALPIHFHLDYPRSYDHLPLLHETIIQHAAHGR